MGENMKGKIVKEYDHPKYPGFIIRVTIQKNGNVTTKFLKKGEKKDTKKAVQKPAKVEVKPVKK